MHVSAVLWVAESHLRQAVRFRSKSFDFVVVVSSRTETTPAMHIPRAVHYQHLLSDETAAQSIVSTSPLQTMAPAGPDSHVTLSAKKRQFLPHVHTTALIATQITRWSAAASGFSPRSFIALNLQGNHVSTAARQRAQRRWIYLPRAWKTPCKQSPQREMHSRDGIIPGTRSMARHSLPSAGSREKLRNCSRRMPLNSKL